MLKITAWATLLGWGYKINRHPTINLIPGRKILDFAKASSGRSGFNAGD
jgi:hypothetical protein